ncbi:MAG: methyltransferase domain-containing protein [Anaerolineales bacterium]|nr:methyltransferase domain-containing protein [Anaerolineales bacterium]
MPPSQHLPDPAQPAARDFLWLHLRELPYFRSLVRAVEARFYQDFDLPAPTLDVGCGDGHFTSITFPQPLAVGIDPWIGPLRQAARRGCYNLVLHGDGGRMPFPDGYFASALSNSVLEHIPHVDAVLAETARVLCPEALFLFCVPSHNFLSSLSVSNALDRIGLRPLGNLYRRFFNRISRHYHCDPPEVWEGRLQKAGFTLERWWHYLPPQALHVVEWGHYFGLPSLVAHWLLRRWILVPQPWNLALTRRVVGRFYDSDPVCENGVYSFYVARRNAATPILAANP